MARSNVRRLKRDGAGEDIETLHERLSKPALLPGEDAELFEAMSYAIRGQLAPRGILQQLACDDIINLRWEILRHRRLRKKGADQWFAANIFTLYQNSDIEASEGGKLSKDEQLRLSYYMISDDPDFRADAEEYFDRVGGVDRDILLAQAYASSPTVKVHDAKLNMLMRQHRIAMQDYLALRAAERLDGVADAELAEATA